MKKIGLFASILIASMVLLANPVLAADGTQDAPGSVHCHTGAGQVGTWITIAVNGHHCVPTGGGDVQQNSIFLYMTGIIKFLTLGAGILAVGGVVLGGIKYSTAKGNPGQVQKAVTIIVSSIIALVLLFLLVAIFNYIIPGGIFVT